MPAGGVARHPRRAGSRDPVSLKKQETSTPPGPWTESVTIRASRLSLRHVEFRSMWRAEAHGRGWALVQVRHRGRESSILPIPRGVFPLPNLKRHRRSELAGLLDRQLPVVTQPRLANRATERAGRRDRARTKSQYLMGQSEREDPLPDTDATTSENCSGNESIQSLHVLCAAVPTTTR